jgi:hypothetical protein
MSCKQRLHEANYLYRPVGERYSIKLKAYTFKVGNLAEERKIHNILANSNLSNAIDFSMSCAN